MSNLAFIDGQNLYKSTKTSKDPWEINLKKFRIYLKDKYNVKEAYYFLGYIKEKNQNLYDDIQKAGFILKFKKHSLAMIGKKKGNIDTDLVFTVMKMIYKKENFDNIILVSGDGDYKIMVDFLIEENKFEKIIFPDQNRASSLYKDIDLKYRTDLNTKSIRKKVGK
jgi:uncharacterized LabA/DUF88 family protein